ncbi:MAG: hypothetical protein KF813_03225 [Trueperaceae bacterium]|nr:hypothetical protein [Trueperaceae bacterium]
MRNVFSLLLTNPVRRRVSLALGILALFGSAAHAQLGPIIPDNSQCPGGAWCHPQGSGMSLWDAMVGAADVAGTDQRQREKEGDCSGLGLEGCIGLAFMIGWCYIDWRDWVQEHACNYDDLEAPASKGSSGPNTDAAPILVGAPELIPALRDHLTRSSQTRPLHSLKLGDRGSIDFYLQGLFTTDERNTREYAAYVVAVDSLTGTQVDMLFGAANGSLYAGPLAGFAARR